MNPTSQPSTSVYTQAKPRLTGARSRKPHWKNCVFLLSDLDLVEHSDILGIDSVPGDLAELVLQAIAPEAWETEQEVEQDADNATTEEAQSSAQRRLASPGHPRTILQ